MSYDLRVWTALRPPLPASLPDPESWVLHGEAHSREGRNWQIVVSGPHEVLPEDVPAEVAGELPGIGFLTELSIEPITAPKSALQVAQKAARAIGKAAHGVVVDEQEGTSTTPAGVKRFVPAKRPERFSVIDMTWWFTDSPVLSRKGVDDFVRLLEQWLPEALPKRYGLFEPPQHRLEETGLVHFKAFLIENITDIVVWYPHRPVVHVNISPQPEWGVGRLGFRCGYASVAVERSALTQPGWQAGLTTFWKRAAQVVTPFYGDVRTLNGFVRSGGTYAVDMATEQGPVRGPFWRGVPRDPGHACVCGPAYLKLWPRFAEQAETEGSLGFITSDDWLSSEGVVGRAGPLPEAIAQLRTPEWIRHPRHRGWVMNWNTDYPPSWPFGERPPPDRS